MNLLKTILLALPVALVVNISAQASTDAEIVERIAPVSQVCLQGEECEAQAGGVQTAGADQGARSGEAIYTQYCQLCHATGLAGAPKQSDSAAWKARLASQGSFDALLQSAITGINAMPPKGTCSDCSDDELAGAVEFVSGLKR